MNQIKENYIKKIAHIGIAVKELEKALPFYEQALGLTLETITEVPAEGVKVAFLKIGDTRFELLEPLHEQSPVYSFIEKRGEGIHHIAMEVDNIDQRLANLKAQGIKLIDEEAKTGADHTSVAFLHPKEAFGVLYELCEKRQGGSEY